MKKFLLHFFIYLLCLIVFSKLQLVCFSPIFNADHLIFPYAIHPFDICSLYPDTWIFIKKSYLIVFTFSYTIIHFYIVLRFFKIFHFKIQKFPKINKKKEKNKPLYVDTTLKLKIGNSVQKTPIFITEKGLFQNILITGTIGSGKTSSAMYPFPKQLIAFEASDSNKKLGILILDVKRKLC